MEIYCERFCIGMLSALAFIHLSDLFLTMVNYYVLDLADESFYLNYPTVYVNMTLINLMTHSFVSNTGNELKFISKKKLISHLRMLPFDWKTPLGYFVAWFGQTIACGCIILADIPYFTLIFASSWIFIVFTGDLRQELATFNNDIITFDGHCDAESVRRFCNLVQFYTDAKR